MTEDRRYPLCWPQGWTRTPGADRKRARYRIGEEHAKKELMRSLRLLGASGVLVSTNIRLRNDGMPFVSQSKVADPGVAVYWTRNGREEVIACDAWDLIGDNFRAIGLAVEALRALERSGATDILERAFTGFAALPASTKVAWRELLGIPATASVTVAAVNEAYRALALKSHPDNGGTHDGFLRLNEAREAALRELAQ